jgi:hypothetical protein
MSSAGIQDQISREFLPTPRQPRGREHQPDLRLLRRMFASFLPRLPPFPSALPVTVLYRVNSHPLSVVATTDSEKLTLSGGIRAAFPLGLCRQTPSQYQALEDLHAMLQLPACRRNHQQEGVRDARGSEPRPAIYGADRPHGETDGRPRNRYVYDNDQSNHTYVENGRSRAFALHPSRPLIRSSSFFLFSFFFCALRLCPFRFLS